MPNSQDLDDRGPTRWIRFPVPLRRRPNADTRNRRSSTDGEPPRKPSLHPSLPFPRRAPGQSESCAPGSPPSPTLSPAWPTLWVVSDNVRQVSPPAAPTPVVLLSLKSDFTDEELRLAGVAAYAGPGSTRQDVVRCLVAARRGRWAALRGHLPEPLRRLTPRQRVLARWLLAGEGEDAIAQGTRLEVGVVRQELLSLQALLGAASRRDLVRLLAPGAEQERHPRPRHASPAGWSTPGTETPNRH